MPLEPEPKCFVAILSDVTAQAGPRYGLAIMAPDAKEARACAVRNRPAEWIGGDTAVELGETDSSGLIAAIAAYGLPLVEVQA